MSWMNLEPVTQSEVSKREKYHSLTHIYGIQKDGTDEPICRAAVGMQTQKTDLWTRWGKERVGQVERVAWKHTICNSIPYVIASRNLVNDSELKLVISDNQEEWGGMWWEVGERFRREGTYVYLWLIHVVWQKPIKHCNYPSIKNK